MEELALQEQYPLAITIALAVLILGITWLIEHIVFRLVRRIGNFGDSSLPASSIFANIARVCIWLAGIAVVFRVCFDYDITAFVAALGVGGIAISLGLQDTLSNLIGGLQVSLGKLVEPDEYIEVLGQRGLVKDVNWRHTTIVDLEGHEHLIPNSLMNKNSIVDLGRGQYVRASFLIPIDADLDVFTEHALSAVRSELSDCLMDDNAQVRFLGSEYAGMKGYVLAQVSRTAGPPDAVVNRITRAIDPFVKELGPTN